MMDYGKINFLILFFSSQSGLFSPFPVEVCHEDDKLPPDPFFESLQRDDVFQAELAEVYTPWKFFLHYAENMQALNRMMNDLK